VESTKSCGNALYYILFSVPNQMISLSQTRSISSTFLPFLIVPGLSCLGLELFLLPYPQLYCFIALSHLLRPCSNIKLSETIELTMLFKIVSFYLPSLLPPYTVTFYRYMSFFLLGAYHHHLLNFVYCWLAWWNASFLRTWIVSVLFIAYI
jgi:hypothetical protein